MIFIFFGDGAGHQRAANDLSIIQQDQRPGGAARGHVKIDLVFFAAFVSRHALVDAGTRMTSIQLAAITLPKPT